MPCGDLWQRIAPSTPIEHQLHSLWSDVLGHGDFGVTDNFFMVGGHSLSAAQLVATMGTRLGTMPVAGLFRHPSIREQAMVLRTALNTPSASADGPPAATAPRPWPRWPRICRRSSREADRRAPVRAIVIDDSRAMRTILKRTLAAQGFEVVEAGDGRAALTELERTGPLDLALVDWNMPELSGLDFVKAIRAMSCYKDTPIVMVTSEAAKYNVLEAIEVGVTNYVVKPVKAEVLKEKLGKYIVAR